MNPFVFPAIAGAAALGLGAGYWQLRRRALDRWLLPYLLQAGRRKPVRAGQPVHLLLCIADHYEPKLGGARSGRRPPPRRAGGSRTTRGCSAGSGTATAGRRGTRSSTRSRSTSRSTSTRWPTCAGTGSARSRSTCTTTTTPPTTCAGRWTGFKRTLVGAARAAGPRPAHRRGELRVHPRELGAGQLAARRPVVRGEQRTGRPAGDRLLRRLHPAVGPEPRPRRGRSTASTTRWTTRLRPKSHDTACPSGTGPAPDRRPDDDPGAAGAELVAAEVGPDAAARERVPAGEPAAEHGPAGRTGCGPGSRCRPGPDWYFVKLHTHGANEANMPVLLGEPMVRFHGTWPAGRRKTRTSTTTT